MFVRGLLKATKSTTSIKRIQSLVRKPISSSRLFSTSTNQTTNQTNQSTSSSLKNQTLTQQQQSQLNANSNEIDLSKLSLEELMESEDPETFKWKNEAKLEALAEAFVELEKREQLENDEEFDEEDDEKSTSAAATTSKKPQISNQQHQQQKQQEQQQAVKEYKEYLKKLVEWEKKSAQFSVSLSPLRFLRFFAKQKNSQENVIYYYKEMVAQRQQLDLDAWNSVFQANLELKRTDDSAEILRKIESFGLAPKPQLILSLVSLMATQKDRVLEAKQLYKQHQSVLESVASNDLKTQLRL